MKSPIRVVLADDSSVVRRLVANALRADGGIEVSGMAKDGLEAVEMVRTRPTDLVLLDVEMPEMDGVEAVREIRKFNPLVPIIMFSSLTTKGAAATLDALAAGASDFVPKPCGVGHVEQAMGYLRKELIPKIKQFSKVNSAKVTPYGAALQAGVPPTVAKVKPHGRVPNKLASDSKKPAAALLAPIQEATHSAPARRAKPVDVVAIASSTGGPTALEEVLSGLPGNLEVTILVVQHMPPVFTQLLAERLSKRCRLQVREAQDGATTGPGQVWIAPGDHHLRVEKQRAQVVVRLDKSPHVNSCRPAADVLFRSVAEVYGARALAVVLTGMGKDGLAGCREIRARGGRIFVQDQATSVVWGMPRAVQDAGLAERCLPLQQISQELLLSLPTTRHLVNHT